MSVHCIAVLYVCSVTHTRLTLQHLGLVLLCSIKERNVDLFQCKPPKLVDFDFANFISKLHPGVDAQPQSLRNEWIKDSNAVFSQVFMGTPLTASINQHLGIAPSPGSDPTSALFALLPWLPWSFALNLKFAEDREKKVSW